MIKETTKTQSYEEEIKQRGTGKLESSDFSLRYSDPSTYFYNKFKQENNKYLQDSFWSEAAKRGELEQLIFALDSTKTELPTFLNDAEKYTGRLDYDTYMLALQLNNLDDSEKKDRLDSAGNSLGSYTDKQWGTMILQATKDRWDAEIIEEEKDTRGWLANIGTGIVTAASRVGIGALNVIQSGYNLLEALVYGVSGNSIKDSFIKAFGDDKGELIADWIKAAEYTVYDLDRQYTGLVDAVAAYDQGFKQGTGKNIIEVAYNTEGIDTGYTTWGRWVSAAMTSIGEMLAVAAIPLPSGANSAVPGIKSIMKGAKSASKLSINSINRIRSAIFYTHVFSSMTSESIQGQLANGVSYEDINIGEVISNGIIKSTLQYAIELGLGKLMGFSGLDKMLGISGDMSKVTSDSILKTAEATGLKAAGTAIGRGAYDMLKEGLEETFQDMADGIIDCIYGGEYAKRGSQTLSISNLLDSFIVGALTSGVVGFVKNLRVLPTNNRNIGVNEAGETYKLGFFEQLNYNQAMGAINEWKATLDNPKSTAQEVADASVKLSFLTSTIGNVLKTFGSDRTARALDMLNVYKSVEDSKVKNEIKTILGTREYGNRLYVDFINATHKAVIVQNLKEVQQKALKTAIDDKAEALKKQGVENIESIITEDIDYDNVGKETNDRLKSFMEKAGASMLVGTDGTGVTRSKDVIFAKDSLIKTGNVTEILKGLAYEKAVDAIIPTLSKDQQELLIDAYKSATDLDTATLEDATIALLFDKSFYTYVLLRSNETLSDSNKAIKILTTIDKIIKGKISGDVDKGVLTEAAYKVLLNKIQENMRAGILVYATNYVNIDLDAISANVLPPKFKELIRTNKNVIFTDAVNDILSSKMNSPISQTRITMFDTYINKYIGISESINKDIDEAKVKIRSDKYNDRYDACRVLDVLALNDTNNKLIYLKPDKPNELLDKNGGVLATIEFFDIGWEDLISGNFDLLSLNQEAQTFILENGYDINSYNDRIALISTVLNQYSGGTLTLSNDGEVLQILDKNELVKSEYLTEDGNKKLLQDIKDGKVKLFKDICKVTINNTIGNLKILYNPNIPIKGVNALYDENRPNEIVTNGVQIVDELMHEATHATQHYSNIDINGMVVTGGDVSNFASTPKSVISSINKYIKTNFPLSYKTLQRVKDMNTPTIIYFNLQGEIQARANLNGILFESGFKWNKDKTVLYSPDGKTSWNLILSNKVNADRPLKSAEVKELTKDSEIQKYMKDAYLKDENGNPIVFYRFSAGIDGQLKGNMSNTEKPSNYIFLSTEPIMEYSEVSSIDTLRGYISNLTKDDLLIIDNKGNIWNEVNINDSSLLNHKELLTAFSKIFKTNKFRTDKLADYIYDYKTSLDISGPLKSFKDIKGIYLLNVREGANSGQVTNDLILFDKEALKRVTVDDNYQFVNNYLTTAYEQGRYDDRHSEEYVKEYIENYKPQAINASRKISNKIAQESNLKYFIKKGKQIQLDERVQEFVINTTSDFDKLEKVIKDAIKKGSLTYSDIINYVETTNNMNDYTFKTIAKYIYQNEEVAKLTYNDMIKLLDDLEHLDVLNLFMKDNNKKLTPKQMLDGYKKLEKLVEENPKLKDKFNQYLVMASSIKEKVTVTDSNGKSKSKYSYVPYDLDPKQLHGVFMRHYDGTLKSIGGINMYGKVQSKNQELLTVNENEGSGRSLKSRKSDSWNWIDRMRKADIQYASDENTSINEVLSDIPLNDKLDVIKEHILQSIINDKTSANKSREEILNLYYEQTDRLLDLNESEVDKLYMLAKGEGITIVDSNYRDVLEKRYVRKVDASPEYNGKYASRYTLRNTFKGSASVIAKRLAGSKVRFRTLDPKVQALFKRDSRGNYSLDESYKQMSDSELEALLPLVQKDAVALRNRERLVEAAKNKAEAATARLEKQTAKLEALKNNRPTQKSIREKIEVVHKVEIKNENFKVSSREQAPSVVKNILATAWDKTRTTTVKGLTNNIDQNVANGKTFFEQNAELLNMSTAEAEQAAKWFMNARLTGSVNSLDSKKFEAIQLYFLGYVFGQSRDSGKFTNMKPNVKQQMETFLRDKVTSAGTALAVWNNLKHKINPEDTMWNASVSIGGVELSKSELNDISRAVKDGDISRVIELQNTILKRIKEQQNHKQNTLRKITSIRSMAMLSSPLTALRNLVSNVILKRLNILSSKIGNKIFTSKTASDQLKFTQEVTSEITSFINTNFIDNKLFDNIVSNISKYNPSDIATQFKNADGTYDKRAILSNMIIKSMYGKFYSENMFKSKFMNGVYKYIMTTMSDNNYVREAAVRYFGKILAEKKYNLTDGVTDEIMTDFANAIGMAMSDYMHSDNFLNSLEATITERGEGWLFIYKNLLPFVSTSWNWFKAMIKFSPIGLGQSIIKLSKLESQIRKAEANWAKGQSQLAPEYTEYLIRRDLGAGIIGTIGAIVGILLGALGFITLEEDDYGIPKLRIGNLSVDVSSIFGTSSLLAGAALVTDFKKSGVTWKSILNGLDNSLNVTLDGFFLMDIMQLDMYSGGGSFATFKDFISSTLLSFIPNGLAWLAGATYTGTLNTYYRSSDNPFVNDLFTLFKKAAAKIPFLGTLVNEKKVDPYTGKNNSIWSIFNRILPYFDINMVSLQENAAKSLGLNKQELTGKYTINDTDFTLSPKDVATINKMYGEWNAKALTEFLKGNTRMKVKNSNGTYEYLYYKDMTDSQAKNAISNIMSGNAENAKIAAWLLNGNSYYASASKYAELKELGISGNLYRGDKGFVSGN